MSATQQNEKTIFETASEIKTDAERTIYLDKVCGSNLALKARIVALLQARDGRGDYLDTLMKDPGLSLESDVLEEKPGMLIGRYKLLEKIGEGGMAVVYMAEQTEPIRRKVALKIIKLGMDTKQVIARFEAERQALAMMDHPNIAKVLDAGATEAGRPYFVMELVTGVSITKYCDKNNLSTKDRLSLFIQVCNAVQHAHEKGIIHRDIKPTNVLVAHHDGRPVPKVIDFGIAKATNQRLTEKTLFTRYAHIIGTPAYMSPEQAQLSDLGIDSRSDIYSLGVLLYELLTGTTPFSEEELRKAGYIEMQRVIREQEPPKPSTKLRTLGETLTDVAKHRDSSPDLLTRAIRGDLDWIVMKSLEKARERRYDNTSALALDIERHLKDQPILARAPGTFYRLHKFFRRHRFEVAASLIVSVLAVTLLIVVFSDGKFDELPPSEREVFSKHRSTLRRATDLFKNGNHDAAWANLVPILYSEHVGSEARRLHARILAEIGEHVRSLTEEIKTDPEDARNYLLRAQRYCCLGETANMIADMEMYVNILIPLDETNPYDLWFRDFLRGLWQSTPMNLGPTVNSWTLDSTPSISADGLELIFNDWGLWVVRRATVSDPWGEPENDSLINVNTSNVNSGPYLSSDGLSLFLFSWEEKDLYVSTRPTRDDLWSEPVNLGPTVNGVDSAWVNRDPSISADGLVLLFSSLRPGVTGGTDLWMTRRSMIDGPWSEPVNLGPTINSGWWEYQPEISADGRTLLFCSNRDDGHGDHDIWQVEVRPVVDLNGDGVVNSGDMTVMVNHWGEDYSPCDIGPTPFGDGIVDVEDLIVLSEHLFEEVDDPTLVAHWPLDEAGGGNAVENVSGSRDIVMGSPLWQPTGGMVAGALELDGVDDVLLTQFGPNPADPEISSGFSVVAWIKGGAAGQVIVSRPLDANWLMADSSDGRLMSELKDPGGSTVPLISETVITNGEWHRIGLVWDGSQRTLSVDGFVVAEDTPGGLGANASGLYIGVGKDYAPGTFFSGLIDDVRIYNRAVKP